MTSKHENATEERLRVALRRGGYEEARLVCLKEIEHGGDRLKPFGEPVEVALKGLSGRHRVFEVWWE